MIRNRAASLDTGPLLYTRGMSVEVSFTADGIGAVYTSSDVLTGQDLLDADARLREEVKRNSGIRYLLVDHSAITEEQVDSASIRALAEGSRETLELIPVGIVAIVAPNEVLYGLSRMWESLTNHPNLVVRIKPTREEAVAWLQEELAMRQLPCCLAE